MRIGLLFFLLFFSTIVFSQKKFSKEFSLLSDNDLYTSVSRDRYYSNGLFLAYRTLLPENKNEKLKKRIQKFQLGHMIYTPIKATLEFASEHDRPFAAYFFGEYGVHKFYKNQNIVTASVQVGVIGKSAKGEQLQNFIHGIYNYPPAKGWKHQIRDAFGLNINLKYLNHLTTLSTSLFDVSSFSSINAGTIFTDISAGVYTRFGFKKLQKLYNSAAFHSNLNTGKAIANSESFIFVKPLISYVAYDATIQGSFLNTSSPVTYEVMPFKFSLELGYQYSNNRFNFGYSIHYHTKKLKSIRVTKSNLYGSIYLGYYFN